MNNEREIELLIYSKVCFNHCTSPFETIHLIKKNVTADECKDLSNLIADVIDLYLDMWASPSTRDIILKEAEQDFQEILEEL